MWPFHHSQSSYLNEHDEVLAYDHLYQVISQDEHREYEYKYQLDNWPKRHQVDSLDHIQLTYFHRLYEYEVDALQLESGEDVGIKHLLISQELALKLIHSQLHYEDVQLIRIPYQHLVDFLLNE